MPAQAALPEPLAPQGRYELREVIASGGMGTIRRAYDRLSGREVAYKRLRIAIEASRPRLTALFQREFDTLSRLEHPNIVQVFDYGFDEEGPFYTMELLSGDDLTKLAPLPHREACRILRDIASALALLHARRLLHRDVSPNNVRLTGDGRAKLIDFGALTPFGRARETAGTPAFIAPECLQPGTLDQRTDLYALGALGYWALTRRPPVRAYSLDQLPEALRTPVVAPSQHVPEIPTALDDLVMSLLAHDRNARPTRALEVIERLTQIADLPPERNEQEVAFSYLKHPPLQGREELERKAYQSLEAALSGRGEILWIEGAGGTGRSAVLEQLGIEAQLRGATVLRADARVHSGALGLASHLMHTGLLTFPDVAQAFRDRGSVILLTPHAREGARHATEAAERNARLSASIQDVLLHLALRSPLVLLVDDAHLADPESLSLLAAMAESVRRHPILLALTATSGRVKSDAESKLLASSKHLTVTPLSEQDLEQLVQTMFSGAAHSRQLAQLLHAESGGNPAHCMDLVRLLLHRGTVRYVGGGFTLPPDAEQLARDLRGGSWVESRLAGIRPSSQHLAELLSLYEGSLTLGQLARASQLPTAEVIVALAQLRDLSIVVGEGDQYAHASQAMRAAIAEKIEPERARPLHLSLARVLLESDQPSIEARLAAGLQRIRAGGAEALEGAELILATTEVNPIEISLSGRGVPYLEAALRVLSDAGRRDADCLPLLATLSAAGFWGHLTIQKRYLDRTVETLSRLTGLDTAKRIERWLGPRLALVIGLFAAGLRAAFRRERRSLATNLASFISVTMTASAASASALDPIDVERVVGWMAPFRAASPSSVLRIAYEFCKATAAVSRARYAAAYAAYGALLPSLEKPVRGLDERAQRQLLLGCHNGIAQACAETQPERALAAADVLERDSVFFAPHAEATRMGVEIHRGELEEAEAHRARGETLALRGGISWSATVLFTVRAICGGVDFENVIGLVRSIAELERLADLSPGLSAALELAQAQLLSARGRVDEALPRFEAVLASEAGMQFGLYLPACTAFARALNRAQQHERAKKFCEETLAVISPEERQFTAQYHSLIEQLALAEAGLGNLARATELLELAIPDVLSSNNPLRIGALHRGRAQVALMMHDAPAFEEHFTAMDSCFRATQNPWLIQQCDALLTRAVRAGIRPAASAGAIAAIDASSTDMDGTTQVGDAPEEPDDLTQPHRNLG